jgi:hypothetical protein
MARGCHGRFNKGENKNLEGSSLGRKNLERLSWEGENPQKIVVQNDGNDNDRSSYGNTFYADFSYNNTVNFPSFIQ